MAAGHPGTAGTDSAGDRAVALWLGGDVQLGAGGRQVLAPLHECIGDARGIVNLEGPILAREPRRRGPRLFTTPDALRELHDVAVRVAAIANDHAGDAGAGAAARTAEILRDANIAPAGPGGEAIVSIHGLRLAVAAHDLREGVSRDLGRSLRAARANADVLIACFHVTGPDDYRPVTPLRAAVDSALAAGALVVVSHGTHALGPVERRGPAVIAWGLGDLAYDFPMEIRDQALILRVALEPDSVRVAEVIPIQPGSEGRPVRCVADPDAVFDLLEALHSTPLHRSGDRASF